jgi:hypothetical protein
MNEPKRRGRPTNAERDRRAMLLWKARMLSTRCTKPRCAEASRLPRSAPAKSIRPKPTQTACGHGQSESADRPWRVSRVKEALEGQGLSMDGVELPA